MSVEAKVTSCFSSSYDKKKLIERFFMKYLLKTKRKKQNMFNSTTLRDTQSLPRTNNNNNLFDLKNVSYIFDKSN